MFQRSAHVFVGPDPMAGIVSKDADAATLRALADFFEYQAQQCRAWAAMRDSRTAAAEGARRRREEAKGQYLRVGARVAVLARSMPVDDAKAVVMTREREAGHQASMFTVSQAHTAWRKLRAEKRTATRDVRIFKMRLAGTPRRDVAGIFAMSERQVQKICRQVEQRLAADIVKNGGAGSHHRAR